MAAPALGGDFGEYLYVITANAIVRFDRMRDGEMFADALYVAQAGASRVDPNRAVSGAVARFIALVRF
jgi:hypothetical protein